MAKVVPFHLSKDAAEEKFRHWANTKLFAPSGWRRNFGGNYSLKAKLTPHWVFSGHAYIEYEGSVGTERSRLVYVPNSNTYRREVYVDWETVTGRYVDFNYRDITSYASYHLDPEHVNNVSLKWDLSEAVMTDLNELTEQKKYGISKYEVEDWTVDAGTAWSEIWDHRVKGMAEDLCIQHMRATYKRDRHRVHKVIFNSQSYSRELVYLPVFALHYQYGNALARFGFFSAETPEHPTRTFECVMNGQNAEISGDRQYSFSSVAASAGGLAFFSRLIFAEQPNQQWETLEHDLLMYGVLPAVVVGAFFYLLPWLKARRQLKQATANAETKTYYHFERKVKYQRREKRENTQQQQKETGSHREQKRQQHRRAQAFNHYQTLQVHKYASTAEIKAAYINLAKLYHPDRNTSPHAAEHFKEINKAYAVLRDPVKRREYDSTLH